MPINYYPQRTTEELLVILDSLQKRTTQGAVFYTTAAGLQQQRSFQGSSPVHVEIRRVLYALWKLDSEAYENPYAQRIRKTRARYTES